MRHRKNSMDLALRVESWTTEHIARWISGVCPGQNTSSLRLHSGKHLILVDNDDLVEGGIKSFGKRKMILQALTLLKYFCYEAPRENLETLCASLAASCEQTRQELLSVQGQRQVATKRAQIVACLNNILSGVSNMVEHAKKLIFWLDRSPFDTIVEYMELRQRVVSYTKEICELANDNPTVVFGRANYMAERVGELGGICEWVCTACDDPLIVTTGYLVQTTLTRKDPATPWGVDLQSSYRGVHVVNEVRVESPADGGKIDAGDELIMIDDDTVIGWDLSSVANSLAAPSLTLSLLVRKRPLDSPSLLPKSSSASSNAPKKVTRALKLAPGSLRPTVEGADEASILPLLASSSCASALDLHLPHSSSALALKSAPPQLVQASTVSRRRSHTFVHSLIDMAFSRTKRRASVGGIIMSPEQPMERPTNLQYDLLSVDTQGTHVVHRTRTMRHQPNGYTRSFVDNKVIRDTTDDDDQLTYNVACPGEFAEVSYANPSDLVKLGLSPEQAKSTDPEWASPIAYAALRPYRMVADSGMSSASHESAHVLWDDSGVAQSPSAWSIRSTGSPLCVVSDTDILETGRAFEGWIRRRKTSDELRDAATNKWPKCWMRLVGSHLYLSDNQNSKKPSFIFCLSECTVSSAPALKTSKKFVFAVSRCNFHFYFSCYSQPDLKSWVQKINTARHTPCERAECLVRSTIVPTVTATTPSPSVATVTATTPSSSVATVTAATPRTHPVHHPPLVTLDMPTPATPPDTPASN